MKNALHNWKNFAKKATNVQMAGVLYVVYFIFIIPLSGIVRLLAYKTFAKFSQQEMEKSAWMQKSKTKFDLEWAKKQ